MYYWNFFSPYISIFISLILDKKRTFLIKGSFLLYRGKGGILKIYFLPLKTEMSDKSFKAKFVLTSKIALGF